MVSKYEKKARDEKISRAVIGNKTTKSLKEAKAFITDLLELRKSTKLKTTYVTGTQRAIENNGYEKVYLDFRFDGTVTGRLSCGGATKGRKNSDKMGVSFHTLPQTDEDYETDLVSRNIRSQSSWNLRHFKIFPGELLPFGSHIDYVPPGTTVSGN